MSLTVSSGRFDPRTAGRSFFAEAVVRLNSLFCMARVGVVFAMKEELSHLLSISDAPNEQEGVLGRFWTVEFGHGSDPSELILALSGIGKVRAAAHTTELITRYSPDWILSVGLSGAISDLVGPGDVVVVTEVYQHDFDLGPLSESFPQRAIKASRSESVLEAVSASPCWSGRWWHGAVQERFQRNSKLLSGTALSGDRLISSTLDRDTLQGRFPTALCVDMELYAVGLVAKEAGLPFSALRLVSDQADEDFDSTEVLEFCISEGSRLLAELTGSIVAAHGYDGGGI